MNTIFYYALLFFIHFTLQTHAWGQEKAMHENTQPKETNPYKQNNTVFEALKGPSQEQIPGGILVTGAYGATMILVLFYIGYLGTLHHRAHVEIEWLKTKIHHQD